MDNPIDTLDRPNPVSKKIGRPKKKAVEAKKAGIGVRPVGRPKGDAAIINEYKARMLNSPKSRKVLDAVFNAALNDDHKHQAAAWKLILDRVAPMSAFEQDIKKSGGKSGITINISGIGEGVSISGESDIEAEYEEVDDEIR